MISKDKNVIYRSALEIMFSDRLDRHFFSGPEAEGFGTLEKQHIQSVKGGTAICGSHLKQACLLRIVNDNPTRSVPDEAWKHPRSDRYLRADMPREVALVRIVLASSACRRDASSARSDTVALQEVLALIVSASFRARSRNGLCG